MKLFETRLVISILSEDEPYSFNTYDDLAYDVIHGHNSGHIEKEDVIEHSKEEFIKRCQEHGTDPTFFLAIEGED